MYKLLLVTDQPQVTEAFMGDMSWESLGFRVPRMTDSARAALESLQNHHADGIAVALPAAEEEKLMAALGQLWPMLPIMRASSRRDEVCKDVQELGSLLNRLNADDTDQPYSQEESMRQVRHAFFRELLDGRLHDRDAVRRRLRLMRSRMNPDKPCVLIQFALPEDEDYLEGRWHYGPERLEVAMRNLFGAELRGMRLLVSVLPGNRIYLLACPMLGCETQDVEESMTGIVSDHAVSAIEHVREYLGIDMTIASVDVLPTVAALADERGQ